MQNVIVEPLGGAMGMGLMQVTVVLAVGSVIARGLRHRPAARHAVLVWALIAAGVCPVVGIAVRRVRWLPVLRVPHPVVSLAGDYADHGPQAGRLNEGDGGATGRGVGVLSVAAPMSLATGSPADFESAEGVSAEGFVSAAAPAGNRGASTVMAVWFAGVAVLSVRLIGGLFRVRALHRSAVPIDPAVRASIEGELRELLGGAPPPVLCSEDVDVPVAIGFLRPTVVVPARLVAELPRRRLLQLLAHEAAHALRRDAVVGLYQRVLGAVLWFHPLVHLVNRALDRAREDVCDNWALRTAAAPGDYARTLLAVAEAVGVAAGGDVPVTAVALFRRPSGLERRIAGLISERRSTMIRMSAWKVALVAVAFVGCGSMVARAAGDEPAPGPAAARVQDSLTMSGVAPAPPGASLLPHAVRFEQGATKFLPGDDITIDAIRGTAPTFVTGQLYEVTGSYTLASQAEAVLHIDVTSSDTRHFPQMNTQSILVRKGTGRFALYLYMWTDGWPHVSYYPSGKGGESFGGNYFGTGEFVLRHWWGEGPSQTSGDSERINALSEKLMAQQRELDRLRAELDRDRAQSTPAATHAPAPVAPVSPGGTMPLPLVPGSASPSAR